MTTTRRSPVFVIGPPRSGTTFLFNQLRASPNLRSLPMESRLIWSPLVHPARHGWKGEIGRPDLVDDRVRSEVERRYDVYAYPTTMWKGRPQQITERRRTMGAARALAYSAAYKTGSWVRWGLGVRWPERRIIDKNVAAGLWPELIEAVYPDASFIVVFREPHATLRSLRSAWLNPDRFFSYRVPGGLEIGGYPFQRWNFGLPVGWREVRRAPLEHVVAFCWVRYVESLLDFAGAPERRESVLPVILNDLLDDPPATWSRVSELSGLEVSDADLRPVNATPRADAARDRPFDAGELASRVEILWDEVQDLCRAATRPPPRTGSTNA